MSDSLRDREDLRLGRIACPWSHTSACLSNPISRRNSPFALQHEKENELSRCSSCKKRKSSIIETTGHGVRHFSLPLDHAQRLIRSIFRGGWLIYCSLVRLGPPENGQTQAPWRFEDARQAISIVFTGENPSDLLVSPLPSSAGQSWRAHFQSNLEANISTLSLHSSVSTSLVFSRKSRPSLSIQLCVRDRLSSLLGI